MLQIHLLGRFQLIHDGQPVTTIHQARQQAFLAYLLLHRNAPHARRDLASLFWPDVPQRQAFANLRKALHRLRSTLPDADQFLDVDFKTVGWRGDGLFSLDVTHFEEALVAAEAARQAGHQSQAARLWAVAAESYGGELLPKCYDDWLLLERERLHQQFLSALTQLAGWRETQRDYPAAIRTMQQLLRTDPLREVTHRRLMQLYLLNNEPTEALRVYHTCKMLLRRELNVDPSSATQEFYNQILTKLDRSSESSCEESRHHSLATPVEGLRERQLPQKAWQIVSHRPRHNLPLRTTPFIGRTAEVTAINEFLTDPERRLVTILGPGGIGKSQLALEIAKDQLSSFHHGVYFVPLISLDSPDQIVSAVADALRFSFYEGATPRNQLLDYLREKTTLLLLDNFEHLLTLPHSQKSDWASLIIDLLQAAPGLKILVTSQIPLNVQQEQLFRLSGLEVLEKLETDEARVESDAVELFLHHAHRIRPDIKLTGADMEAVGQICRLVRGMPLGILLAASWTALLSPTEIAAEMRQDLDFLKTGLRDVPARQQSIRAVFDRTWQLLTARQQIIFRQLSVFWNGFTREAAQEVTGVSLRELLALVNHSLVSLNPVGRYEVHELLRQFASEKLRAAPTAHRIVVDPELTFLPTITK